MVEKYPHQEIESRWQKRWAESKAFAADARTPGEKKFVLDMFPYPSGDGLHVGHPEGYTATDIYSRFLRMNGVQVLHPMGWDAFGLPAENFAIKMGVHPAEVTAKNIANFKRQIQSLGFSYDWNREVNTTDPAYYKWTQWIFLQLFKRGLAYEKEAPIWWCPKDKTGLANEEVVNGKCDRCGTVVEKKMLKQWMLKITAYADRLLDGLNDVDWPEGIKTLQRNWIGKSEGAEVKFLIPSASRAVLLHGFTGNPHANFFPWLKSSLESAGTSVEVPALPNTENPTVMDQVKFVEKHCTFTEDTMLFGHSLGAPVALKVIERLKHPIAKLVLAGGFTTPVFEDHERPFASTFDWKFDWKNIRKNVSEVVILHDTNDYAIGIQQVRALEQAFGVTAQLVQSKDVHFCATEEPTILNRMLSPVTVFTTRPDTLFGATYLVLSPEHELVKQITTEKQRKAVEKYVKSVAAKSDLERTSLEKEKTGVFTGAVAVNPVNNEKIPVWIADYVLSSYGTGAIMAVPAHDERDQAFAKKFKLPIITVVEPPSVMPKMMAASAGVLGVRSNDSMSECWTDEGTLKNSGAYDGMDSAEARDKIVAALAKEGKAKATTQYKLRDWVFSRQRYWGEPIPLVHCEHCKKQVESTPHYLNFYNDHIWENLTSGRKTIETRALNPEEPDRYFGKLKIGDVVKGIFKPTGATAFFRITAVTKYASLAELYADKRAMSAVAPTKTFATPKELEEAYERLSPGYGEKIRANGLVAFKLESVVPGVIAVPENQLPLELPKVEKYEPTGTGESPLAGITDWVNTECPACAERARKPKYLIFDFDGVIGNTLKQNLQAKVNMGHSADLQEAIKQTNEYFSAKPNHVRGEHFDKAAEKKYHDWSRRFADEMVKLPYKLFTGFVDEIQKVENAKIAVVSAGYDLYSKGPLEKSGLSYTHLLAGNHHHSKETKIEDVCRAWGVDIKDVYYFTDTQADVYELENLLDRKKIIGCAWGFQGSKKLHEVLPPEQVLEEFADIHKLWQASPAKRETNTMPQWAGSCWYYLRFCDPKNAKEFASAEAIKAWLPVDMYVGGAEHAVLHLLYARFWHKVLFDAGHIPSKVGDEPFKKLKNQGLILGPDGEKMSKSRGNVINPDEIVEQYGADTLRMYEMFMGPFEDAKPWDTNGILGVRRFLEKVWRAGATVDANVEGMMTWSFTAKRITEGIQNFRFNTCVSDLMKFANTFTEKGRVPKKDFEGFLKLLHPFAPHITEELWERLGNTSLLAEEKWVNYDPNARESENVTIAIQVMGKLRGTLSLPTGATQDDVEVAAKAEPNVSKYLTSEPKKVIFVKDKLINFVI